MDDKKKKPIRPTFLADVFSSSSPAHWGDPRENRKSAVPFGIAPMDARIPGVPIRSGGIFGVQGLPGTRKTTLLCNLIVNMYVSGKMPAGYMTCIDTLESGMTIERYSDTILAIVATRILVGWHWVSTDTDIEDLLKTPLPDKPVAKLVTETGSTINEKFYRETNMRPDFFKYSYRTPRQHKAISAARDLIAKWPIAVFGVSEHPDPDVANERTVDVTNLSKAYVRWCYLAENHGMKQLVIDHLQQYMGYSSDYERMRAVTHAVASWQKKYGGIAWVISQVGVTASRDARTYGIRSHAAGGNVLEAEAQYMGEVDYKDTDPWHIILRRPLKSRIGVHPTIQIPIDPESGSFIGAATEYKKP